MYIVEFDLGEIDIKALSLKETLTKAHEFQIDNLLSDSTIASVLSY